MTSLRLTGLSSATRTWSGRGRRTRRRVRPPARSVRAASATPKSRDSASSRSECLTGLVRNASMPFRWRRATLVGLADRRQHHDRRLRQRPLAPHAAREHEAVDFRHLAVGNHHVEAARRRRPPSAGSTRPTTASAHRGRPHVPAGEHLFEDAAVGGVVVDDEHAQSLERLRLRRRRARPARCGGSNTAVK